MVRMRSTSGKGRSRRAQHGVATRPLKEQDGVMRTMHRASRITGKYRQHTIEKIANLKEKREARAQAKREAQQEVEQPQETATLPENPTGA